MRTNDAVRERLAQIAVRSHLSDLFRADVAAAKSCATLDEKRPETGIALRTDEAHGVRYIVGENDIQRVAETGDHVDARETFYLGERQQATLTISADSPPLVRCTIQQAAASAEPEKPLAGAKPRPALTIAAVLGRSRRLGEMLRQATAQPKVAPDPNPSTEPPPP